jgi:hypothetical protein
LRGLAPDEVYSNRPTVKQGLVELKAASRAKDFIDLPQQAASAEDLAAAAAMPPAGGDGEPDQDDGDEIEAPPVPPPAEDGVPQAVELPAEVAEHPELLDEVEAVGSQDEVMAERLGADASSTAPLPSASPGASSASGWVPEGPQDAMHWKRRRTSKPTKERTAEAFAAQLVPVTASDNLRKKALDREVPFHMIPRKDIKLYEQAERKEWKSWQDLRCVEVVPPARARELLARIPKSRIIRLRFVYKDKNAALRTEQTPLPVRAKARL